MVPGWASIFPILMSMGSCSIMFPLILGSEINMRYQHFIRGKEYTAFYGHVFLGTHFWINLKKLYKCDIYVYTSRKHTHEQFVEGKKEALAPWLAPANVLHTLGEVNCIVSPSSPFSSSSGYQHADSHWIFTAHDYVCSIYTHFTDLKYTHKRTVPLKSEWQRQRIHRTALAM